MPCRNNFVRVVAQGPEEHDFVESALACREQLARVRDVAVGQVGHRHHEVAVDADALVGLKFVW